MRLFLLAAAVLAPALAGCIGSSNVQPATLAPPLAPTGGIVHGLDGLAADPILAAAAFDAAGAQFRLEARAFEPTLGVTMDGALFMTAFAPNPTLAPGPAARSSPTTFRSLDRGLTWEDTGPKLPTGDGNPPTTNDPYVYVDPATGRVFQLDLLGTVCSWMSWSDDLGDTWETNPVACGTPLANDHQTMVAAPPRAATTSGYPNVVYYCVNRVADAACATSLDGGRTFGPLLSMYEGVGPGGLCGGLHGHVKAAPDGTVYVGKAHCGVPTVAITRDDGATWTHSVIAPDVGAQDHDVEIAVDEAGNVYAFWIRDDGLPVLAASTDGGATWGEPRVASPPGVTATEFAAVAAGGPGRVAIAYVGTTIEGGYEGKPVVANCPVPLPQIRCDEPDVWDGATWNAYIGLIPDALAAEPLVTTVTANDPADPVARDVCGRTRCAGMGDFIDIVIDAEGRPWAAFVDVCNDDCVTDPAAGKQGAVGFAGGLLHGPALRGEAALLPHIPAQPAGEAAPHGHDAAPAPAPAAGQGALARLGRLAPR